ncbi:anti-anti-sigma factor [Opitutaceae bacterium TAV5]|nr:anti-anti-sigma factor [Opitutaceae bacterium TAV5]
MDITEKQLDSATVLALAGRLDGLSSPALEQKIDALLASGLRQLVFDCAALSYVSSAGLRVFLGAAKKFKSAGGVAAFAALTPAVSEVFELSGFNSVLSVHPGVDQAVAALR